LTAYSPGGNPQNGPSAGEGDGPLWNHLELFGGRRWEREQPLAMALEAAPY
jgi:hypothetical protein